MYTCDGNLEKRVKAIKLHFMSTHNIKYFSLWNVSSIKIINTKYVSFSFFYRPDNMARHLDDFFLFEFLIRDPEKVIIGLIKNNFQKKDRKKKKKK